MLKSRGNAFGEWLGWGDNSVLEAAPKFCLRTEFWVGEQASSSTTLHSQPPGMHSPFLTSLNAKLSFLPKSSKESSRGVLMPCQSVCRRCHWGPSCCFGLSNPMVCGKLKPFQEWLLIPRRFVLQLPPNSHISYLSPYPKPFDREWDSTLPAIFTIKMTTKI